VTKLEKLKIKLEFIEDDPTPAQLVKILQDLLEVIEEKEDIGFKK
jgi:hypothetical protein